MTIYECETCKMQMTTIEDLREHLKENPSHGSSATFGPNWRKAIVYLRVKKSKVI